MVRKICCYLLAAAAVGKRRPERFDPLETGLSRSAGVDGKRGDLRRLQARRILVQWTVRTRTKKCLTTNYGARATAAGNSLAVASRQLVVRTVGASSALYHFHRGRALVAKSDAAGGGQPFRPGLEGRVLRQARDAFFECRCHQVRVYAYEVAYVQNDMRWLPTGQDRLQFRFQRPAGRHVQAGGLQAGLPADRRAACSASSGGARSRQVELQAARGAISADGTGSRRGLLERARPGAGRRACARSRLPECLRCGSPRARATPAEGLRPCSPLEMRCVASGIEPSSAPAHEAAVHNAEVRPARRDRPGARSGSNGSYAGPPETQTLTDRQCDGAEPERRGSPPGGRTCRRRRTRSLRLSSSSGAQIDLPGGAAKPSRPRPVPDRLAGPHRPPAARPRWSRPASPNQTNYHLSGWSSDPDQIPARQLADPSSVDGILFNSRLERKHPACEAGLPPTGRRAFGHSATPSSRSTSSASASTARPIPRSGRTGAWSNTGSFSSVRDGSLSLGAARRGGDHSWARTTGRPKAARSPSGSSSAAKNSAARASAPPSTATSDSLAAR